jgi:hypothetical protein
MENNHHSLPFSGIDGGNNKSHATTLSATSAPDHTAVPQDTSSNPTARSENGGTTKKPGRPRHSLAPYRRCHCGSCQKCKENARWDRIFAKMAGDGRPDERGVFGSTLRRP